MGGFVLRKIGGEAEGMPKTYITISGDMWDGVAYKAMGSELHTDALIKHNIEHRDVFIFPAGVVLEIPDVAIRPDYGLPPWKRTGAVYE
jgi:phage tail protein X